MIAAARFAPSGSVTMMKLPTGTIRQRPPAYSAVKVGGERAYALERRGEAVELAERSVHVSRFELLWRDGERAGFEIECSSGTYVRSLIADLGDAYCLELVEGVTLAEYIDGKPIDSHTAVGFGVQIADAL